MHARRAWLLAAALCFAGPTLAESSPSFCLTCHARNRIAESAGHFAVACENCHPGQAKYPHLKGAAPTACAGCHAAVSGDHAASIHAEARRRLAQAPGCRTCHGAAHELKNARADEFRRHVPELCGACHEPIRRDYALSVHGKALAAGVLDAPVCTDCHGEHSIQRRGSQASAVSAGRVAETCGRCHGDVRLTRKFGIPSDRLLSFNASFHGLAARQGAQTVANCASCHGTHNILPSSDSKSTVHARNLGATCAQCHPGAGKRFAVGPVHIWAGRTEPAAVRLVRLIYTVLIPVLAGLMLLRNGRDWIRKFRALRRPKAGARPDAPPQWSAMRMTRTERVLHATLAVSFVVLAWTGFDLVYPEQWWARPIEALEHGGQIRPLIHRAAAVLFIATALAHLLSLAGSRVLRAHWRELWPSARHGYGYAEKLTYWATVWGAAVMIASGLLLWSHRFALAWLPKPLLDAAGTLHFYEAVLASVTLVLWHLYHTVFDPAIYPMDTTWVIGRNLRETPESVEV